MLGQGAPCGSQHSAQDIHSRAGVPSFWVRNFWGSNLTQTDFLTVTAEGHPELWGCPVPAVGAVLVQPKPWRQFCKTQDLRSLPSLCLLDSSFTPNKGPAALGAREELTKDHSFSAALQQIPHLTVQDGMWGWITVEA